MEIEAGVQRELTVAWGCRLKGRAWPGHHLEGKEQLAVGCMAAWEYALCEEDNHVRAGQQEVWLGEGLAGLALSWELGQQEA